MKQLRWMGRSRSDVKEFPDRVRRAVGHALHTAQGGEVPLHAEVFRGCGNAKVWEIRENDTSGTHRAVYTIEFLDCVVVLHAFQKKAKKGISTPQAEISLIKQRLRDAKILYGK